MSRIALLTLVLAASIPCSAAAAVQEGYALPPDPIPALVDAPPAPSVSVSPDGQWMLLRQRAALPTLADLSRPMLKLAGMRVDPAAVGRFTTRFDIGLSLRPSLGGQEVAVALPDGARLLWASWAPDSQRLAFAALTVTGTQLWCAEVTAPEQPKLLVAHLNSIHQWPRWTQDSQALVALSVPRNHGAAPERSPVPARPRIQETRGGKTPLRTYQDLLRDAHDEALFTHYTTVEALIVRADGSGRAVLDTGTFARVELSPDGRYVLTEEYTGEYSFAMPASRFARVVAVEEVAPANRRPLPRFELPPVEQVPIGGVQTGPRGFGWIASRPATLTWIEALDGGDPKAEVEHRDRWLTLEAPFPSEPRADASAGAAGDAAADGAPELALDFGPRELWRVEHRARGLDALAEPDQLLVSEYDRDRRWTRTTLVDLTGAREPLALEDRSQRDRYGDPGQLQRAPGPFGRSVVRVHEGHVYRAGQGSGPEGDLPFLARQSLADGSTEELWRCAPGSYERVVDLLLTRPQGQPVFLTAHETASEPRSYRLHDPAKGIAAKVLETEDPQPALRGIAKRRVSYERADGVPLSATLYTPAGWTPADGPLPTLVWGYPIEYNDASTAGQVSGSTSTFTRLGGSSHLFLVTQGYAVLDDATMPVVGDIETMNDRLIEQLVSSAAAAILHGAELGAVDPQRVAVAGHSYGAFMTANLLAHSDLFRAGIARSGAYNRTLTPFGFQSEQRTFWQAPETYFAVSPFMHANKINEPLLLIHGADDNNSGTFPIQSERLFGALQGHGATARLVMLPNESHGYRARESVLHTLAEMVAWMDEHVKGAPVIEAGFEDARR